MANASTPTRERALQLLGVGVPPESVASACGVTVSQISQLVSDESFALELAELKFQNLARHNERDNKYDALEDSLLDRLDDMKCLMTRPIEILKAIQVVNSAKRRGASAPTQITSQANLVQITLPSIIVNKFTTNIQNQVIQANGQELLTMQAGTLLKKAKGEVYDAIPQGSAASNSDDSTSRSPEEAIHA